MQMLMDRIHKSVAAVFEWDRFVENYKKAANYRNKLYVQLVVSFAFLLLSIANLFTRSYSMLVLTGLGCVVNFLFAIIARKHKSGGLCAFSAILTCSVLFGYFVICGGNDGFACQWVVLLPLLSMVVMSFPIGLCASVFFQVFLVVVFWTPVRELLLYSYNDQFCLRFPLFYCVTFLLGLLLTISLRRSEYNECQHLLELEEMTTNARILARTDPLTKLANRRHAYEEFDTKYAEDGQPHCIAMGDIDYFKRINDTYGHEFGDEVLKVFAQYAVDILPKEYLKSRWGGEEFLFAANVPIQEMFKNIEILREAIASHTFDCGGNPIHITITFGIAQYINRDGLSEAITTADNKLYDGKNASKNCTVM